MGVDEFHGTEVATALLTLVAIGVLVVAMRAFAHDISVGKELMGLFVVILFGLFFDEFSVIIELLKEVAGQLVVCFAGRTAVDIEADTKLFERVFDELMVAVAHVLRRDTLFLGPQGDGNTVLIAAADEDNLLLFESQIAHVDVGRHVDSRQMTNVNAPVGIGQCRRNRGAFELLFFH